MLIAYPSADAIWDATLSSAQESADPNYAIENLQNNDASDTSRFTASTVNIQIDLGGNVTVVGLGLINTSFTGGTFESGSGAIGSFVFPSRTPDGKQRNGFLDTRLLANTTDDHFELDLTSGSSTPELGRICLVTAWQAPHVLVAGAGTSPTFGHRRFGQVENTTRLGSTHRRPSPVAAPRWMVVNCLEAATLAILQQLEAECNGLNRGFLVVRNEDVNDAMFMQCAFEDFVYAQQYPDSVAEVFPVRMRFNEIAMGLPPALT